MTNWKEIWVIFSNNTTKKWKYYLGDKKFTSLYEDDINFRYIIDRFKDRKDFVFTDYDKRYFCKTEKEAQAKVEKLNEKI